MRKFDGKPLAAEPSREALSQVSRRYPDARLMLYLKHGAALAREMKWLGSYRYAVVNMGAADRRTTSTGATPTCGPRLFRE